MARHTPGVGDDDVTPGHELFAPRASDTGDDAGPGIAAAEAEAEPRLVAWSHRGTHGATGAAASDATSASPAGALDDEDDLDGSAPRSGRRRLAVVVGIVAAAALVSVVVSAVLFTSASAPLAAGAPTDSARPTTVARTSTPTPSATPSPTPTPTASTPSPRAATPPPQDTAAPAPFITPVAAGTVVAEGDLASPKGSIHVHYRVVAGGDDTYATELTNATSSVPVPVGVAFFQVAPSVGDGITYGGDGGAELGASTTTPVSAGGTFGSISQPSYLSTLVVYSTSTSSDVPVELGAGKVLAVAPVAWSVPPRQTNIVPVDGGSVAYAAGAVEATTASGAPKRYTVAPDDLIDVVAQRFGISVSALLFMNQGLQVIDDAQHLFEGTTLVLDPDSV